MQASNSNAVLTLLKSLGVKDGDTLMVHSSFSSIKKTTEGDAEGLIDLFLSAIGPQGTLVMPSFNFDILHKGEEIVFNLKETPSQMGYLTEVFRRRQQTFRSGNLFNPLVAQGRLAQVIAECAHNSCWGDDSPFPILYQENAAILLIGTDYNSVTMLHYAEQRANVPYRFKYIFPNAFVIDSAGNKVPVQQSTFRKHPGYDQDFNIISDCTELSGFVSEGKFGDAIVRLVRAKPLVEFVMSRLAHDPYFLVQRDTQKKPVATRAKNAFSSMDIINELWLLNRSIVSDDYDKALKRLAELVPMETHVFRSGTAAFDWIIPQKWQSNKSGIYDENGNMLIDLAKHPLHIAAGAAPFAGLLPREQLLKKIAVHPERDDAIPYKTCYYSNDWLICLSRNDLTKLEGDKFYVNVDTQLTDGELKVGDVTIPGEIDSRIVFPIHLDHPGQCNDNLSGIAVAMELIMSLLEKKQRHTLSFLFLPETIGSYAYLSSQEHLIPKMKYCITFDSIGAGDTLFFMRTFRGDTELDSCARLAMKKCVAAYREYGFLELSGYGNDERAFQAQGIGIPSISISRHPYAEYHTSLDTPYIIEPRLLREARELLLELIGILNKNFVPVPRFKGVPQLSKRNMWIDFSVDPQRNKAIELFMYLMDGEKSIATLAESTGVSFDFTYDFFVELERHGLISRVNV